MRNPVTAVLLNFRGYDTLLEFAVLLLAAVAARSVAGAHAAVRPQPVSRAGVLDALVGLVVPLVVVVAGYLLWAGAHAPGGAFQAGALLAAAVVLMLVANTPLPAPPRGWILRAALTLGPLVTLSVALGVMVTGGRLMQYPTAQAGAYILLIESAAMLSIAATLVALFLYAAPPPPGHPPLAPQERDD